MKFCFPLQSGLCLHGLMISAVDLKREVTWYSFERPQMTRSGHRRLLKLAELY